MNSCLTHFWKCEPQITVTKREKLCHQSLTMGFINGVVLQRAWAWQIMFHIISTNVYKRSGWANGESMCRDVIFPVAFCSAALSPLMREWAGLRYIDDIWMSQVVLIIPGAFWCRQLDTLANRGLSKRPIDYPNLTSHSEKHVAKKAPVWAKVKDVKSKNTQSN